MVYLSPFYPTSILPKTTYFVKKWADPRFCIMSSDEEEELMVMAKRLGRHLNPMGRKDVRRGYSSGLTSNPRNSQHPEPALSRVGQYPIYYIIAVATAIRARDEGAIVTDERGNYTAQHQTVALVVPEDTRICEGQMTNGDPCQSPAEPGRLHCRLHLETSAITGQLYTAARYKKYLPERLAELYEEALSRPDLLELENQIAVIDAKIMTTFEEAGKDSLPSWQDVLLEVERLRDPDLGQTAIMNLEQYARQGATHDAKWAQVQDMMEQQRKLVETEIRRKKELNLMIPIDRIMLLMASIADVIKRHVKDPLVLKQIKREMGQLMNASAGTRPTVQVQDGDTISVD